MLTCEETTLLLTPSPLGGETRVLLIRFVCFLCITSKSVGQFWGHNFSDQDGCTCGLGLLKDDSDRDPV